MPPHAGSSPASRGACSSKPQTLNPRPWTRDPTPYTLNPKPETRRPNLFGYSLQKTRSVSLDKWTEAQLQAMEQGGNAAAVCTDDAHMIGMATSSRMMYDHV